MPNYRAITLSAFGQKRWQRTSSYAFALRDAVLPLSLGELSRATMSLPIALVEQDARYSAAAVMGVQPERNLSVTTDGRWIHGYIPASCRCYPFRFLNTPDGQQVLCIDEDSGLINDDGDGDRFFDEDGKPSAALQDVLSLLNQIEQSKAASTAAFAVLKKHDLITPWPISIKTEQVERRIGGLFQIDNVRLNQLSAEALVDVHNAGGLLIAYCQLLSMQHLPMLGQLAEAHAKAEQAAAEAASRIVQNGELSIDFLNQGDTMNFGGYR